MKNITLLSSALALGLVLSFSGCSSVEPATPEAKTETAAASEAPAKLVAIEKMGFLTIDACADQGSFQDCYLENYICGSDACYKKFEPGVFGKVNVVLYSHKDGKSYNLDISGVPAADIDKGINRNDVTIIGKYNEKTNTIHATEFKAPPPPKKSFFKGCL